MSDLLDLWILDDGLIMGGGQRFALRLADILAEQDTRVRFVAPADTELGAEVRARGLDLVHAEFPRLVPPAAWAIPPAVLRLREVLADAHSDTLVVGNTARCQAYATAALVTLPHPPLLVHLMHEQESAHRPTARAVYRRVGALVAVGENAAETYRDRLPDVPVACVNNFLSPDEMRRLAAQRTPPPDAATPVLGVLARMIPEKGIIELVEELAAIPGAWERLRVGAPEQDRRYTDAVRRRIAELGLEERIDLLGRVDDLSEFFAAVDRLVVPSTGTEGQPTVILEALLYGRPVIVRAPLWSPDFDGLPIRRYETPDELAAQLADPVPEPVGVDRLEQRFGARQVVSALQQTAMAANGARRGGPSYHDWHAQPGYYRDVTRHFSPGDRILDVGCGTAWLADSFEDYTGVDESAAAVALARSLGRNARQHSVDEPLPFEDASFDAVVAKDLLEHVADPVGVVAEMLRVLRPGGRLFASSPDAQKWAWDDYTHRRPFTRKSYRLLFADQGFVVEHVGYESVMPGIGVVSGMTERKQRPKLLGALAALPITRRNVFVVARRPSSPAP
ncbi:methyltransferase domain-containing protein [Capillimicrobium parvum]|uniref:Ubiquinone biosynthesis O-methyltransferase, mitochondrial n=1 Tax=Capillimicrobium parvum TaxID=2884022 RepID=A0A9E6Y3B5_9ACTN|nr:Ubiquinone biosynthesis O-methyltransferase, mitochondrial [Capillimicrobium parvum]